MRLVGLIAFGFVCAHLWTLPLPPLGHDSWRQADVLGVGRNYCEEGASFWSPRVDSRGDTNGVTGMEFPILNWIEGQLACAGLDQVVVGRTVSLLFSALGIVCVGLLGALLPSAGAAWIAAAVLATSPLVWYFGVSVQPDMPSVALMLASLVLLDRSLREGLATGLFLISAALAALGILIKLPVIVFGLSAVAMLVSRRGWLGVIRDPRSWMYLAIAVMPAMAWYRHARALQEVSGLHTFYLGKSLGELASDWARPSLYVSVFGQKLFDAYAFPVFSLAAVIASRLRWRWLPAWAKWMGVASLLYVMLAGRQIEHHFYYGLALVPTVAIYATATLCWVRDRLGERTRAAVLGVLVVGASIYAVQRVGHWWPRKDDAVAYEHAQAEIDRRVPPETKIAVFSGENPTLLWVLHRKGWLAPVAATEWWAHDAPRPPVVAVDRRMADVAPSRDALLAAFKAAGYEPIAADAAFDVWFRPTR